MHTHTQMVEWRDLYLFRPKSIKEESVYQKNKIFNWKLLVLIHKEKKKSLKLKDDVTKCFNGWN